jgi:hypothetical protein
MTLAILDSLSLAGNRGKPNEDAFGAVGHRLWVIDGATGLGSSLLPVRSDAAWLAQTANRLLHTHADIRDTARLVRVVIEGLASAFSAQSTRRPEERWELPVASMLILTREAEAIEIAWLGDCRAIILADDGVGTGGETPAGEAEERAFAARIGQGIESGAMLRSAPVIEELRAARSTCNTGAKGRWLLGLEPRAADHLDCKRIRSTGAATCLAMTDGFSALELKYRKYSSAALIDAAQSVGLASLATELRQIEEVDDPDGRVFPRFKRSDDATAILARLG